MAFTLEQLNQPNQETNVEANQNLDFSDLNLGDSSTSETIPQETVLTNNENHGLDFLEPKKDINKEAKNDPYRIMVTEKEAYQMTLKTLNALSILPVYQKSVNIFLFAF